MLQPDASRQSMQLAMKMLAASSLARGDNAAITATTLKKFMSRAALEGEKESGRTDYLMPSVASFDQLTMVWYTKPSSELRVGSCSLSVI